jgi:hypothetical protein
LFEPAAIDEFGQCVTGCLAGGAEFDVLDEDRDLAQQRVAAAVVEVQVAVRGEPDVTDLCPDRRQRLAQPHPAGAVVRVNLGMGAHAGVEQDHSLGVADGIAQAGLDPGHPRPGLLRWPYEVAEINAPHRD